MFAAEDASPPPPFRQIPSTMYGKHGCIGNGYEVNDD